MTAHIVPEEPTDAELLEAYRIYSSPADPGISGPTRWTCAIACFFHGINDRTNGEALDRVRRVVRESRAA